MSEFIQHPWLNPVIEKRDYQESIVRTSLTGNTLCVLPTGLGKTNIAILAAAERLANNLEKIKIAKAAAKLRAQRPSFISADDLPSENYAKILMLAPTRPLVEQHKASFERAFKLGVEIRALTGELGPGERKKVYQDADIVIATPQTVRNDIKNKTLDLKNFCLLIVDEAHRCIGNYAYVFVAQKYLHDSSNPLILALTASPGSSRSKIAAIKKTLSITNVEIRSREDADVSGYVQKLERKWIQVELPEELKAARLQLEKIRAEKIKKLLDWRIIQSPYIRKRDIIRLQQELANRKTGPAYAAMSMLAEMLKLDYALLLLETQTLYSFQKFVERMRRDGTQASARLLKNPGFVFALTHVSNLIESCAENPKLSKLKVLVSAEISQGRRLIIFAQYRDTVDKILEEISKVEAARTTEFIGQAKRNGNNNSSSTSRGMSQDEQQEILRGFRNGDYNVLVATSIGEEGLDIAETDAVIFYEPVPSEIRTIQRTGRTARQRAGKVIILMVKGTRDEAYFWSSHHKEKKMKSMLYSMQKQNPTLEEFAGAKG